MGWIGLCRVLLAANNTHGLPKAALHLHVIITQCFLHELPAYAG